MFTPSRCILQAGRSSILNYPEVLALHMEGKARDNWGVAENTIKNNLCEVSRCDTLFSILKKKKEKEKPHS